MVAAGSSAPLLKARSDGADATRALARTLAGVVRAGDLIVLVGDLGAGKTAFVQGLGSGLGVTDRITSPTFVIAQQYPATIEGRRGACTGWLHHLDAYRLVDPGELADVGLAELLDEGGVVVIEWGDTVTSVLPTDYLEVRILFSTAGDVSDEGAEDDAVRDGRPADHGDGDDRRHLAFRAVGRPWLARTRALADAMAPWGAGAC